MKKHILFKSIIYLVTLCVLLCGCAKGGKSKETNREDAITLQMSLPESFNPLNAHHQSVRDALNLCYEPLFSLDENMNVKARLAQSITISQDCLSGVITLKDSILWHDGTEFTSADVVDTVTYIQEHTDSPYYECVKNISSIEPLDPRSVSIILKEPYGQLVYSLYFPVIASHNTNPDEKLIGTGPYAFESYTQAVTLCLTKNEKWHGGKAMCDKVSVGIMRDEDVAASAFDSGSINIITSNSYDLQNNTPKNTTQLFEYPSLQYEFLAFNHNSKIFSSKEIRAAVSAAINREEIASSAYPFGSYAANSPIHPCSQALTMASEGSSYNLANASEMLFLEGYSMDKNTGLLKNEKGEKISFNLLVNSDNQSRIETAKLLTSQLFLAGIEVKVTETDFDSYLEKIKSGSFEAYLGGTTLSNMCDFGFLFSDGGSLNNYGYKSEYMAAALKGVSAANSDEARQTALAAFEEVFLREQPAAGIVFKNDVLLADENIKVTKKPQPQNPYIVQ